MLLALARTGPPCDAPTALCQAWPLASAYREGHVRQLRHITTGVNSEQPGGQAPFHPGLGPIAMVGRPLSSSELPRLRQTIVLTYQIRGIVKASAGGRTCTQRSCREKASAGWKRWPFWASVVPIRVRSSLLIRSSCPTSTSAIRAPGPTYIFALTGFPILSPTSPASCLSTSRSLYTPVKGSQS